MIDLAFLKGSSFVVLGLARSGLATVRALRAAGLANGQNPIAVIVPRNCPTSA